MPDEFDLDPDTPVEGDPPVDAQSMLEVIGETVITSEARIRAARSMMLPYAIRAILNGTPATEVARACGFQSTPRQQQRPRTMFDALFGGMAPPNVQIVFAEDVDEDDMPPGLYQASIESVQPTLDPEFVKWIVNGFAAMVRDGVKRAA